MSRRPATREVLGRVRKSTVFANPDDFYSKLIINSGRRRLLYLCLAIFFAGMFALVWTHMRTSTSWKIASLPIGVLGFAMVVIPRTEKWSYRPWQGAPRLYEKHTFGP